LSKTVRQEDNISEKPTIAQVLHGMAVGGAEVLAARLARRLDSQFRFVFFCLDHRGALGDQLSADHYPVHVLGRRAGIDYRCAFRLGRLLRAERVTILHAHQYTPFFYSLMARHVRRRPAILFTEHGRHFPDYRRRKRVFINRFLLRRGDRVVAVGEAVRQALIANEGIAAERVQVIYNGVHLDPFLDRDQDRAAIRRELNVADETLLVLQVARLDYLKDHATAVRAFAEVVRVRPDACLLLVGEGPEAAKIREGIARLNLQRQVRLLGLRKDVPRLLAAADLVLLTSISEGIPLTVIEAMAAERPVVATTVGGVVEMVVDGETGLLAPAGDAPALARNILRLAEDPALARSLAKRGRARAMERFSEQQMLAAYEKLYEEMLGRPVTAWESEATCSGEPTGEPLAHSP
jgi:glycosyltransferase involved in cell wall biosynthesis